MQIWDANRVKKCLLPVLSQVYFYSQLRLELTAVMRQGTVCTNVYLRLHNLAVDMGWLPRAIIPRRQWPKVKHKDARAITIEEHRLILGAKKILNGGVLSNVLAARRRPNGHGFAAIGQFCRLRAALLEPGHQ